MDFLQLMVDSQTKDRTSSEEENHGYKGKTNYIRFLELEAPQTAYYYGVNYIFSATAMQFSLDRRSSQQI